MKTRYEMALKELKNIDREMALLTEQKKQLEAALHDNARDCADKLLGKINACIIQMEKLGYTIGATIEIEGETHFCEKGLSLKGFEVTSI